MAESEHSLYSASSAHRWMPCPGSIPLGMDSPEDRRSTKFSAEGTLAHTIAAECLTSRTPASTAIGTVAEVDGFTFQVDADMTVAIQVYLDNIAGYAAGGIKPMVEVRVNYSASIGAQEHEAWGTADVVMLYPNEIGVHDLKFGKGEPVSPIENEQMMLYALGALDEYGELMGYDDDTKVTMAIHQPRIKMGPSEWSCTVAELRVFADKAKQAVGQVREAVWDYAAWKNEGRQAVEFNEWLAKYTTAGVSQCRWCPAKATCPTNRNSAMMTAVGRDVSPATAEEFADLEVMDKPAVQSSDDAWLAAAMAKADLVENWLKAVRAEVESRMLAGRSIPGFKVVQGRKGNREWKDPKDAEAKLKAMRLKVEQMYDLSLISPPTAEKLSKGKDAAIGPRQWKSLQELITRADGKMHVAPESDERPAVQVKPVADEFEDLGPPADDEFDIG